LISALIDNNHETIITNYIELYDFSILKRISSLYTKDAIMMMILLMLVLSLRVVTNKERFDFAFG